jgi:hypothetical protein
MEAFDLAFVLIEPGVSWAQMLSTGRLVHAQFSQPLNYSTYAVQANSQMQLDGMRFR